MKKGGDNFRLKACFVWDKSKAEDSGGALPSGWNACVGGAVVVPGTLTVWRRVYVADDWMTSDHSDGGNFGKVAGGFDDGFVDIQIFVAQGGRPHKYWLSTLTSTCQDVPPPDPPEPDGSGIGAVDYTHQYTPDFHTAQNTAPPPHTVQQFGAHVLAREKTGTNPATGEPKLKGKNFGRYCTNDKHSFNARYTIFNANNEDFMHPGDSTLDEICDNRNIPKPDCINEVELNARVPLHELGHNIGGFMDDPFWSGETCQNNPDANNSIMMYNFFYRASFGGWFSCDEIRRLRQAPQQQ